MKRKLKETAKLEKVVPRKRLPLLYEHLDSATETINDLITVNNAVILKGNDLSIDPTQSDEGVFYVNTTDGATTRVDKYNEISPGKLVFQTPLLSPGNTYYLEVRRRFKSNELVTGFLDEHILTAV